MKSRKRDGVALAYEDIGSGSPPLLLVHGWCTDHTFFAPQIEFFGRDHRVVAVDLRGHGASDAPRQDYTMAGFVADLAWICGELGLERPIVVGHSMGGTIALELAAAHPDLASAIMMIDSVILPPAQFMDFLRPLGEALHGPGYLEPLTHGISGLFLDTDNPARKSQILASMTKMEQQVLASAFASHLTEYDATEAIAACRVPIAYIKAATPMVDLDRFRAACPRLMTAQTLGSGHFSPLEVPDQINAMISRFISLCPAREELA
jgi:pimeloyl-ACP methyl ester carboxylesterase